MGINTDLVKITCFMLVGLLSAFSAIMQMVRIEEFHVVLGNFYELQAIAASVIGGVSLFGGRGGIIGIFVGALIIPIVQNGIMFLGIVPAGTTAFIGAVIVVFTLLNIILEEKVFSRR
jgi:ribose/xylose/arabinose/galactoside ABC-type transport system permease subunit